GWTFKYYFDDVNISTCGCIFSNYRRYGGSQVDGKFTTILYSRKLTYPRFIYHVYVCITFNGYCSRYSCSYSAGWFWFESGDGCICSDNNGYCRWWRNVW